MNNEENKDKIQTDSPCSGHTDNDTNMQEKIDAAMEGIAAEENPEKGSPAEGIVRQEDTSRETNVPEQEQVYQEKEPESRRSARRKSARPRPITYVPIEEGEMEVPPLTLKKKKHKGLKAAGIVMAVLIVAAGCAYAGISYYYSDKFFEGTWINGIDCSGMTAYEAEQAIASQVEDYSIQVMARNQEPQSISAEQIAYKYLSDGEVLKFLKDQKPYEWVMGYFEQKSYTAEENISYDKQLLQNEIKALNCAKEENQVEPENAYVAFVESKFEIIPETQGCKLNIKNAYKLLEDAVSNSEESINFAETPKAYVQAEVTKDNKELQETVNAYNNFTKASITYTFGDTTVTLDGSTIKDWLQFDEKGQLLQNDDSFQQHIIDYVAQLAASYDTVGTDREFYTTSGRTVYVYGSAYGWQIDQAAEVAQLTQEIQSGTQITREPVYSMTANARGYNDIGDTYIEVDLSNQHMYYYQSGSVIFESDIVSGDMTYSDRQTPPGIFTLYYKKSPDVLRGKQLPDGTYEYEQPVTYWMPFNGGIGFHDANWQPYFGGNRYYGGGSHGCINLPPENAAVLYSIIDYGVPIVCFY